MAGIFQTSEGVLRHLHNIISFSTPLDLLSLNSQPIAVAMPRATVSRVRTDGLNPFYQQCGPHESPTHSCSSTASPRHHTSSQPDAFARR